MIIRNSKKIISSMSKRAKVLVSILFVLMLAYGLMLYFARQESLLVAATRMMECTVELDARCMMKYMREEEQAAANVTVESLQQYLDDVFGPAIDGLDAIEGMKVTALEDQAMLSVNQAFSDGKGKTVYLNYAVTISDDGPKCVLILKNLYLATATSDWVSPPDYPNGVARTEFMLESIMGRMNTLQSLKLRGIANPIDKVNTDLKLVTWSELASALQTAVDKAVS